MAQRSRNERRTMLAPDKDAPVRGFKDIILELPAPLCDDETLVELIEEHIRSMIVPAFHHAVTAVRLLDDVVIQRIHSDARPRRGDAQVSVSTRSDDGSATHELIIPLRWRFGTSTQHDGYFEGIVQLRDLTDEQMDTARRLIKEMQLSVAKTVDHPNGMDLYVGDNHRAQSLVDQLKRRFGGTVKRSKTLHGVDQMTSRLRYRVTALYRGTVTRD